VRNAIERSGGKTNLWEILPYLPEQTQNYVPCFLAMNYVMNYAHEHQIEPTAPRFTYQNIDTLYIKYAISFAQIAENIKTSIDQLRFLNPTYKLDIIPETGKPQLLVLPNHLVSKYLAYENQILSSLAATDTAKHVRKHKTLYTVVKGDFLHKIAMKYNCNPADIRQWNNLSNDFIAPGQALIIWTSE
jgi:membrane-bound lytic murein transglycosylase D